MQEADGDVREALLISEHSYGKTYSTERSGDDGRGEEEIQSSRKLMAFVVH